jgi:hypothetical protein
MYKQLLKRKGIEYFEKWLANDKEINARAAVEAIDDNENSEFEQDREKLAVGTKIGAQNFIETTIIDAKNKKHDNTDVNIFFLAYYEFENNLEVAIIFEMEKKSSTEVKVPFMSLFYQGVLARYNHDKNNYSRKENSVTALFQKAIQKLKNRFPKLEYIIIQPHSDYTKAMIARLWGNEFRNACVDVEMELPIETICSQCRLNNAIFTFQGIGGSYCSRRCASKHWYHLTKTQHRCTFVKLKITNL